VGNEKNVYPVPDPNKIMINITKKPSDAHQKTLKEEILEVITEKLVKNILQMVKQKHFKTPKIKNMKDIEINK
jgi:hypothetical protein